LINNFKVKEWKTRPLRLNSNKSVNDLYDACSRLQYFLPARTSSLISEKYLLGIIQKP